MKKIYYGALNTVLLLSLVVAPVELLHACAGSANHGRGHDTTEQRVNQAAPGEVVDCEHGHQMSGDTGSHDMNWLQAEETSEKKQCSCEGCGGCVNGHVSVSVISSVLEFIQVGSKSNPYITFRDDFTLKVLLPVEIHPPIQSVL